MTYRQLLEELENLPEDCMDDDVTVYDSDNDEYTEVTHGAIAGNINCDVLDEGHFFLVQQNYY